MQPCRRGGKSGEEAVGVVVAVEEELHTSPERSVQLIRSIRVKAFAELLE
jgi:hypothetical protein